ncbi:hypothetical protein A1O1_00099 [Capronia coronata CBS 617.96]|uniref:Uncharacterized protein n=1 Tax=Capronia coronata CBS 617.96 TaxID=1182541 RepID=W9Z093_9EURO|nr:uncharacterized protein A1O1_00099 [Capronia coronata CBS 617.96]EXJ94981.1 hypothetical protein A1O1_00099 [Capronia coronata CBS 617.96]
MNGPDGFGEPQDVTTVDKSIVQTATGGPASPAATPEVEATMKPENAPAEIASDKGVPGIVVGSNGDAEGDSEAETLIQSPEKQRTVADAVSVAGSANTTRPQDEETLGDAVTTDADKQSRKRKRSSDDGQDETTFSVSSRRSSSLSSPRIPTHSADSDSDVSSHIISRRSKPARPEPDDHTADSDDADNKSVKVQSRRQRPSDILPSISKHRAKNNGGGGGGELGASERRETRSATYPRHSSPERSASPRPVVKREHRRGVSTQLTLGDVERKKRGRPPAIQTRRSGSAEHRARSVTSSDSDSPRESRPTLHKFSSADNDTMSPAKAAAPGPRKWRDKNGRTFLSRACNNNDLAMAKVKLAERPEDLNLADNAGNTPLQIAALEGFTDIVQFLLENKCEVNTRNIDKETPLIDAVENGHVEVVRLLLQYGANPRLGNAKGDEPYELVPQDDENYEEIRRLLADAKEKQTNQPGPVEQPEPVRELSSKPASAASPRDSPPILGPRSPPTFTSRRRTGRSESTRNDLLWQANTQENLTRLAAKGDVQGVANILNILQKAETESLIAAAKAGHEEVLQYLLGMGDPEPDPDPIRNIKPGYNTPMLAAIGRGHPEVVKLLVEQSGFNPARKLLRGKTYFEISAERKGDQWQKEYEILRTAYDKYTNGKSRKVTSPRVTRDSERVKSKAPRRSQSPVSTKLRNSSSSSPTLTHKSLPNRSPQFAHRSRDRDITSAEAGERRRHTASRKEPGESSMAVSSDQDQTVFVPRKAHLKKRSQSDLPQPPNLHTENTHRRRRLVTGKEHRRRKSLVAEESSDNEEAMVSVKAEGRPATALKRTRESMSPESAATEDGEIGRGTVKKRRTVVDSSPEGLLPATRKRSQPASPDQRRKSAETLLEENSQGSGGPPLGQPVEAMEIDSVGDRKETTEAPGPSNACTAAQQSSATAEGLVKTESVNVGPTEAEQEVQRQEEQARKVEEARKKEEARLAEEARKAEEARLAEKARKAEEARLAEEARKADEARLAEEARRKAEAEEARRLEEEKIAAQKAAEKAAEEQRVAEEQERRRKAEEEAAALRKKEEEERQERLRRELEERQRRQEEQLRQQRLEMERRRREALPIVLSTAALMIDNNDPTVKGEAWLKKFLPLFTVRTAQLDPNAPSATHDDLWIPNFQVAGLLVTKDLHLRNYTSLEVMPVTPFQRTRLWQVSRNMLSFEYQTTAWNTSVAKARQREEEERPKFMAMKELFWVKLSGFEDQVPRHPHLAGIRLWRRPISLRVIPGMGPARTEAVSPVPNGLFSSPLSNPSPKLANGINSHSTSSTGYGNGLGS